jgi:hypothetical protein
MGRQLPHPSAHLSAAKSKCDSPEARLNAVDTGRFDLLLTRGDSCLCQIRRSSEWTSWRLRSPRGWEPEPAFAAAHVLQSQWFSSGFSHIKGATATRCVGMFFSALGARRRYHRVVTRRTRHVMSWRPIDDLLRWGCGMALACPGCSNVSVTWRVSQLPVANRLERHSDAVGFLLHYLTDASLRNSRSSLRRQRSAERSARFESPSRSSVIPG